MTKIKICGLSRIEDITAVNRALPDYIGFVFAPSRRRVDERTAKMLRAQLDPRITAVGVFVNQEIEIIAELYRHGVISIVQLHGDEDAEYIERLKEHCNCLVIKAIGIDSLSFRGFGGEASALAGRPPAPPLPGNVDYILFDTLSSQRGGTGKAFDWSVLRDYNGPPFFLAGGLNIDNISDAIRSLDSFCLDVSSGAEIDGRKDADKIGQIVRLVRDSQQS